MRPLLDSNLNCWACSRHWMRATCEATEQCSCTLSGHSNELSPRNVPKRFYDLFDPVEAHLPNYWPGTYWCTKCATIADKVFAEEKDYIPPANVSTMFRTMFPLVYISSHLKRYTKFFYKMDPRRLKTLRIDTYNFLLGNKKKDKMRLFVF